MEKLSESKRAELKKMADARLIVKLLQHGKSEEEVVSMKREELLHAWAEMVIAGAEAKEPTMAKAAAAFYDIDFEKQRFEFEMRRYEEEKVLRRREIELREIQIKRDQEDREYRREMDEIQRKRVEDEIERQRDKDRMERERQDELVCQLKLFGNAMKGSAFTMTNDPLDLVPFFNHIEQLFGELKVNDELKVKLLRPYLNERAKVLVARMDATKANDFKFVKEYLLREFQLSPKVYLERFNTLNKSSDETYLTFASKLKGLIDFYLSSRKTAEFDKLVSLLVTDRMKQGLSDACLRHVLTVEATTEDGWLDYIKLAEVADTFQANQAKLRVGAIGYQGSSGAGRSAGGAFQSMQASSYGSSKPNRANDSLQAINAPTVPKSCFKCKSFDHLLRDCPRRRVEVNAEGSGSANLSRTQPKTAFQPKTTYKAKSNRAAATLSITSGEKVNQDATGTSVKVVDHNCNNTANVVDDVEANGVSSAKVTRCTVSEPHTNVSMPLGSNENHASYACRQEAICCTATEIVSDAVVDELSPLRYINVTVQDTGHNIYALEDGGTEIAVIKASCLPERSYDAIGTVKLRGIVGLPVVANVIKLPITLTDSVDCSLTIICAVCEEANEDLILPSNVVDRLFALKHQRLLTDDAIIERADGESANECSVACNDVICNDNSCDKTKVAVEAQRDEHNVSSNDLGSAAGESFINLSRSPDVNKLSQEQRNDDTLKSCFRQAQRSKGGYFLRDHLLYRHERLFGRCVEMLVVPKSRRENILHLAHDTSHQAMKKTRDRIRVSLLTWPTLPSDCRLFVSQCHQCQVKARITCYDRVPITAVERAEEPFQHWFMDCAGPLIPNSNVNYNYCLIMVCSYSRYPVAVPLSRLTAKNICDALLTVFSFTGLSNDVTVVSCDNASYFNAALTRECLKRLGVSPRFSTPLHPEGHGLAERYVGSIKQSISKLALEHPRQWHKTLPFVLWAMREVPNSTTGVSPHVLCFGKLPRGPLAILKESWTGEQDLPVTCNTSVENYLAELKQNLVEAGKYADEHAKREQRRYVSHYNLRSRDKHFVAGESVLVLLPDSSSSKVFSKWRGPAKIIEVTSPYSYIVELDNGQRQHLHANRLRKYHLRVDEITCSSSFLSDWSVSTIDCACAVIYERDVEFGRVDTIDPEHVESCADKRLISQRIDPRRVNHLSPEQCRDLFKILDKYPECFTDAPGFCSVLEHEIPVTSDFRPKRLPAYRVPENLKEGVNAQIKNLLQQGIIKPSKSPMSSPIVCVIKGERPANGIIPPDKIRICVNYQYVNKYTIPDAITLTDISEVIQRVGKSNYISLFDAKSGYHQLPVRAEDQWLTAFVCDLGLFEWTRTPFGMRSSGCTFIRAIRHLMEPIREFVETYVDEMAVHSETWEDHLRHLDRYLAIIKSSGLTINLDKCDFVKPVIRYVGHLIGSGYRSPDPVKVEAVMKLRIPETKKQVRQIMGLFSHFRDYIPRFSDISKPITDLTGKRIPSRVPWGEAQQAAFDQLREALCKATENPLRIIDSHSEFLLYVDSSGFAVGCVLTQYDADGLEKPVAFASSKLTPTQCNWATIEKEAYAAIWALQRYRHWLFGAKVTLFSDHNPLSYLCESAPKSAKLMRWYLALQEYNVIFSYRAGKSNLAADCLSRMVSYGNDDLSARN
jgi:transposase InsO family protein